MDIRKEQAKSGVILHITGYQSQPWQLIYMLLVPRYDMSEGTNTQRDGLSQHKGTYTVKWEAICSLKQVLPEGQSVRTNTVQEEQGIFGELSR